RDDGCLFVDGQRIESYRLGRRDQDAQRPGRRNDRVRGNAGEHVAREAHVLGGEKTAAARVIREFPRLLRDPRDHGSEYQVEASALQRTRLVVQAAHVALEQRVEQLLAEGQQLSVVRQ